MKEYLPTTLRVLMLVAVIGASTTPTAWAGQIDTVVYPTGTFPQDVENVQSAVNQGGTVLLKATEVVDE